MEKIRHKHENIAPLIGTYFRTVRDGNLLFISGCTALGSEAEGGNFLAQAQVTLERITRIVEAEGGTTDDIVQTTTYVTDMNEWGENRLEYQELMEGYFKGKYPTSPLVATPALVLPTLKIEIEAMAVF